MESCATRQYEEYKSLGGDPQDAQQAMIESFRGKAAIANKLSSWVKDAGGDPDAIIERVVGSQFAKFQITTADNNYVVMMGEESDGDDAARDFLDHVSRSNKWWPHLENFRRELKASSPLLESLRQNRNLAGPIVSGARTPERCVLFIRKCLEDLMNKAVLQDSDIHAFYETAKDAAAYDELALVLWLSTLNEIGKEASDKAFKSMLRRCAQEIRFAAVQRAVDAGRASEYDALCFVTRLGMVIDASSAGTSVSTSDISDLWAVVAVKPDGIVPFPRAKVEGRPRSSVETSMNHVNRMFSPFRSRARHVEEDAMIVTEVSPIEDKDRLAYLEMLARPEVMTCIWRNLFVQYVRAPNSVVGVKPSVNNEIRNCLCMLMALATVYLRHRNEPSSAALPLEKRSERDEARELEDNLVECVAVCEFLLPGCRQRLFDMDVTKSVRMVHVDEAAADAEAGAGEAAAAVVTCKMRLMKGVSQSSAIAYGIIMWAREGLLTNIVPENLKRTCLSYLEVLEAVAEKYVFWRDEILSLYADAYAHQIWERTSPDRHMQIESQLRLWYGTALISMVRLRCATRVVDVYRTRFAEHADLIDRAQVRTFVCTLLRVVRGACAPAFAVALLRLLHSPTVADVLRGGGARKVTLPIAAAIDAARDDVRRILASMPGALDTAALDRALGLPAGVTLLDSVRKEYDAHAAPRAPRTPHTPHAPPAPHAPHG